MEDSRCVGCSYNKYEGEPCAAEQSLDRLKKSKKTLGKDCVELNESIFLDIGYNCPTIQSVYEFEETFRSSVKKTYELEKIPGISK